MGQEEAVRLMIVEVLGALDAPRAGIVISAREK